MVFHRRNHPVSSHFASPFQSPAIHSTGSRTQDVSSAAYHNFDELGEISVFIYRKHHHALVDTGAMYSVLSLKSFKRLPKFRQKMQSVGSLKLCGANKQPLNLLGQIILPLTLKGLTIQFSFVIVAELVHEIILGQDFLSQT